MTEPAAQEFSVEVAAAPRDCFETITDFEHYPRWSSTVKHTTVLARDDAGLARRVELRIDLPFRSIRYVLAFAYRKPSALTWHSVEGDIESIEGEYRFRKLGPGRTQVTCRQAVRLGFWLPAAIRSRIEQNALRDSVLEFTREVERRLAAAPAARTRRR